MSKPLRVQVVEMARSLIEDEQHWCRVELARDVDSVSVCPTDSRAVRPLFGTATLVNVNDVRGHVAVLALLDEVLAVM